MNGTEIKTAERLKKIQIFKMELQKEEGAEFKMELQIKEKSLYKKQGKEVFKFGNNSFRVRK